MIVGSAQDDVINAGAGEDTICGLGGEDSITRRARTSDSRAAVPVDDTFQQGAVANGADRIAR